MTILFPIAEILSGFVHNYWASLFFINTRLYIYTFLCVLPRLRGLYIETGYAPSFQSYSHVQLPAFMRYKHCTITISWFNTVYTHVCVAYT